MKRIIFGLFLLAHVSITYSQPKFGIKGGININNTFYKNLPSDYSDESKPQVGFHLGGFANIKLSKKFGFTPELQFIQKGFNAELDEISRVNINYIEVPLIFSFAPIKLFSIDLGPVVGFKISAKSKTNGDSFDLKDVYDEPVEVGLSGGLRFNVSPRVAIAGRYYYGLTSIGYYMKTDAAIILPETKEYNTNIQFSVYYSLTK